MPVFYVPFYRSVVNGLRHLTDGELEFFLQEFKKRLWSTSISIGLRRDLWDKFQAPEARIHLSLRPFEDDDFEYFCDNGNLSGDYLKIIQDRRNFIDADIPTCYVAVCDENKPCYMQWLISPGENEKLQQITSEFPALNNDEALLEGALVRKSCRGMRIMPAAMARIAEKALDFGARWVITFVDIENIPSLKGCRRSGFSPYILRKDRWILFRRFITYEKIPDKIFDQYFLRTEKSKHAGIRSNQEKVTD